MTKIMNTTIIPNGLSGYSAHLPIWIKEVPIIIKGFIIMKLFTFYLLFLCSCCFGEVNAQKISINVKAASFKEVAKLIHKQSGHSISISNRYLEVAKPVTLHITDADLQKVLEGLFRDQPFGYIQKSKSIIITDKQKERNSEKSISNSIQQPIRGRVSNEKGEPLAGASIYVLDAQGKRTTVQTKTDEKGYFELDQVAEVAKLEIGYLGYTAQRLAARIDMGSIALKPFSSEVEEVEVVSTGYQQLPKERATGSFEFIDNKKLNEQVGTNILQRLDGIASGVLFDTQNPSQQRKTNITVRGLSTIHGPLDPLIVLDGFPFEGNFENINPNDIENITILKDAAAASIWGARAGNGVIILTTKKGKFNQPLQVGFNSNVIVNEKPDLMRVPQISSADYVDFEKTLFDKGYFNNDINNRSMKGLTPAVEIFRKMANHSITEDEGKRQLELLKNTDSREQYIRYMYQAPITQQYSLNLRGGSDNLAWLISGSYDDAVSNLDAAHDKLNFRFDNTYRPIKNLKVNVGVYYTQDKTKTGRPGFNSINNGGRITPYLGFVDENGNPEPIATTLRHSYTDTAGMGKLLDWKYYPMEDYKHNATTVNTDEIVANAGVNYTIIPGLDLDVKYQYQLQRAESENYMDIESFQARDMINRFSQLNRNTGVVTHIVPMGGIMSANTTKLRSFNSRAQLNYIREWTTSHQFTALAGAEVRQVRENYGNSFAFGYNKDPLYYSRVDQVGRYPDFVTGALASVAPYLSPEFISKTNRFVSAYANFSYIYAGRYILTGSMRNDASNIFGVAYHNKWKPLWSVGGAWELSKEPFYNFNWIPYVKLRATYGHSGNVDPSKTSKVIGRISTSYYSGLQVFDLLPDSPPNPELRWEKVTTLNLALEFASKNSRISGSLEWYNKRGRDLYGNVYYDYTAWGTNSSMLHNAAESDGRGYDLTLNSKNFVTKDFLWQTSLIISQSMSKTVHYNDFAAKRLLGAISLSGEGILPIPGYPLYAIAAYKWAGLDASGNPQGYLNGEPSTNYSAMNTERGKIASGEGNNLVYFGSTLPTVFGNLNNAFQYKDLRIVLNFTYKLGYYFRQPAINYNDLQRGAGNGSRYNNADYHLRWQKPGDELTTNVPAFVYPVKSDRDFFYNNTELHVMRGDHIRLQYINMNYTFNLSKGSRSRSVDVYANLANLGIIWRANKAELDPENIGNPPPPRQYALGLRANF